MKSVWKGARSFLALLASHCTPHVPHVSPPEPIVVLEYVGCPITHAAALPGVPLPLLVCLANSCSNFKAPTSSLPPVQSTLPWAIRALRAQIEWPVSELSPFPFHLLGDFALGLPSQYLWPSPGYSLHSAFTQVLSSLWFSTKTQQSSSPPRAPASYPNSLKELSAFASLFVSPAPHTSTAMIWLLPIFLP